MGIRMVGLGASLAWHDLRSEWPMIFCHTTAIAAILIPLFVFDGLRTGIVAGMTDNLRNDPANLRLNLPGTLALRPETVEELRALPGVGFLIPTQRAIATRSLVQTANGEVETVDFLPTAQGDPLLGERIHPNIDEALISNDLADRLALAEGEQLTLKAARHGASAALLDHKLEIIGILPSDRLKGRFALVAPELVDWLEAFRDDYGVPEKGIEGADPGERPILYENLRLYADRLESVPVLASALRERFGFSVRAAEQKLADIRLLDSSLAMVFWLIGGFALLGMLLSMGASLWADVERKRQSLGMLFLLGAERLTRLALPLTRAIVIALFGLAGAVLVFLLTAQVINRQFSHYAGPDSTVCAIEPLRLTGAGGLILATAFLSALAAGYRVSRLEPTDGMRQP